MISVQMLVTSAKTLKNDKIIELQDSSEISNDNSEREKMTTTLILYILQKINVVVI